MLVCIETRLSIFQIGPYILSYFRKNKLSEHRYRNRFLASVAIAQLITILIFRLWPDKEYEKHFDYQVQEAEAILIDEIEITRQETSPPPPPKPQIMPPVPSDEIVEIELDVEMDLDIPDLPDLDPGLGTGSSGDEERVVNNPQIPPTVVRIVEATAPQKVPDEYKDNLEMIVNFLVDTKGEVEEVSIMEIRLYSDDGSYEELPFVQYGLMDAVLNAAMQWRFRPARQDGEVVKAFTRQRFNY